MTDLRTAAQQALEALESLFTLQADDARPNRCGDAIAALRAALEQPEQKQKPVALPCCGYTDASAIKWNPFNGVVQCHNCGQTYTAIKAALEQPEQEPVAWMGTSGVGETIVCKKRIFSFISTPLYTHPKRRSWQGLTQGEHEKARHVCRHVGVEGLVLWLEDKLKERNA